jgi:hypothetical protein
MHLILWRSYRNLLCVTLNLPSIIQEELKILLFTSLVTLTLLIKFVKFGLHFLLEFLRKITQPNKKHVIFFPQAKLNLLLITSPYLVFFPARQVSEMNLNESSKNTENALIE